MELQTTHLVAWLGFIGGAIFAVTVNKTHFCSMGSISDWINMDSKVRFRSWMLAAGIAVVATQALVLTGVVDLSGIMYLTPNFLWFGYIFGGLLFGIGMTLGSGCGQKTLTRVGTGNLKSLVVLLMLGFTAYMTLRGVTALFRIATVEGTAIDLGAAGFQDQSVATFISRATGLGNTAAVILSTLVIGVGLIWYAFKDSAFRGNFNAILAGMVIGLLAMGAWIVTGVIGYDDFEPVPLEGLTFISPTGNTINYLMTYTGSTINFGIALVFGMLAGSFLYALVTRSFRIEYFSSRADLVNHLVGGALMGFGGVLSLGCTIGQGVTGVSTLSLGSFVALFSIIAGGALTMKMQYYMIDESFARSLRLTLADFKLLPAPRNASTSS
jgi:uncharacterized membrane protein YedE/YeeE